MAPLVCLDLLLATFFLNFKCALKKRLFILLKKNSSDEQAKISSELNVKYNIAGLKLQKFL